MTTQLCGHICENGATPACHNGQHDDCAHNPDRALANGLHAGECWVNIPDRWVDKLGAEHLSHRTVGAVISPRHVWHCTCECHQQLRIFEVPS